MRPKPRNRRRPGAETVFFVASARSLPSRDRAPLMSMHQHSRFSVPLRLRSTTVSRERRPPMRQHARSIACVSLRSTLTRAQQITRFCACPSGLTLFVVVASRMLNHRATTMVLELLATASCWGSAAEVARAGPEGPLELAHVQQKEHLAGGVVVL